MKRIIRHISAHRNWVGYYLAKINGHIRTGFTFRLRNEWDIHVPKRLLHTYKEIFFDDTYLGGFPPRVISNQSLDTVLDVGANVGYFSLMMASKFPDAKILACEPMPNNLAQLRAYNQELNTSLTIIPNAIAGKNGHQILFFDEADAFTTSASSVSVLDNNDQIKVETMTLHTLMSEYQLQEIDLLKLDCEGAEYDILLKADPNLFDRIHLIAMEYHPDPAGVSTPADLIQLFRRYGYQLRLKGSKVWAWK